MFCFDDIIRFWDKDIKFTDILLAKKSYETSENILIYDISYGTLTGAKPLRIRLYVIIMSCTSFRVNLHSIVCLNV